NHFCVSADKIVSMAGAYEREAIRPHVLGRFVDMLTAVESHPAMLFYLDNLESMGPNSIAGINRDKSLNENLAREILELHARRPHRLFAGRRHTFRQSAHWVDLGGPWRAQPWRGVRFRQAPARAGRTDGDRQDLSRHWGRSGPRRARRS